MSTHEDRFAENSVNLAKNSANFAGIYMRRYRGGKTALDVQHAMRTELFESLSRLDIVRSIASVLRVEGGI